MLRALFDRYFGQNCLFWTCSRPKKRRIFRCILKACVRVLNNDVGGHAITNANGLRKLLQGPVSSGQSAA